MPKLSLMLFSSVLVLASVGCASTQPAQRVAPPQPAAWAMMPPPDLTTPLNGIISLSESESLQSLGR
ncbi:Rz1 family lipoprotein [Erwinia sp. MYb416]|uniref:Rz1 family lipoprotein n=1 Tax=Erwinia sp. MYb416 TaxID=3108532 RepID=UPI0030ACBD36